MRRIRLNLEEVILLYGTTRSCPTRIRVDVISATEISNDIHKDAVEGAAEGTKLRLRDAGSVEGVYSC